MSSTGNGDNSGDDRKKKKKKKKKKKNCATIIEIFGIRNNVIQVG